MSVRIGIVGDFNPKGGRMDRWLPAHRKADEVKVPYGEWPSRATGGNLLSAFQELSQ